MEKFAEDYSKLFQSTCFDKEVKLACHNIEEMLTRLEELENLLVNVKSENNVLEGQIEMILDRINHFKILQRRIDKLEEFVSVVDNNVAEVEKAMDKAENQIYGESLNFKNLLLKPFMGMNKANPTDIANSSCSLGKESQQKQLGVHIFKTNDYFTENKIVDSK